MKFFGDLAVSLIIAVFATFAFEAPIIKLGKFLSGSSNRRPTEPQPAQTNTANITSTSQVNLVDDEEAARTDQPPSSSVYPTAPQL